MTLNVRRVVTGHDAQGNAIVLSDEVISQEPGPIGLTNAVLWSTQGNPASNDGDEDMGKRNVAITEDDGSIFRVINYPAGGKGRFHRTNSIDYIVIMSGEIDLYLDGDNHVRLRSGDVCVQRGTIHQWRVPEAEDCLIAFVLIDSKPVEAGGKKLEPAGF